MIGWYVHHHGLGHLQRLRAIAPHLTEDLVVFSSLPEPHEPVMTGRGVARWVQLPSDSEPEAGCREPARADPTAGGLLHWAPVGHRGHAQRLALMAQAAQDLTGCVVDVSVEVAVFMRLMGVPVALFTQPGDRTDEAHQLASVMASVIIAPLPAALTFTPTVADAALAHLIDDDRVVYTGGIAPGAEGSEGAAGAGSRSVVSAVGQLRNADVQAGSAEGQAPGIARQGSGAHAQAVTADAQPAGPALHVGDVDAQASGAHAPFTGPLRVLVVGGAGGSTASVADFEAAAAASRHSWTLVGLPRHRFSADVAADLAACDVAIIGAGLGSVAQLAASGRPGVVLVNERPFDEQVATGRLLADRGMIVRTHTPHVTEWDELLDEAMDAGPLNDWHREDAPTLAAAAILAACGGREARGRGRELLDDGNGATA